MTEDEIKAWYKKVYTEIFNETNKLDSRAASFAAGMAVGILGKHVDELIKKRTLNDYNSCNTKYNA